MNSAPSANRAWRAQSSDRGRGRGNRLRGAFSNRTDTRELKPVPTIHQVIPGAPVSIVLKMDQATGHEVKGIVAELLTRRNHPRGIKVRLRDGRVGRVQGMSSLVEAVADSEGVQAVSEVGGNGEMGGGNHEGVQVATSTQIGASSKRHGDSRFDGFDGPPSVGLSLEDYIVVKKEKGKRKGQAEEIAQPIQDDGGGEGEERSGDTSGNASGITSAITTCPVCGGFEGDEMAVAHHVNSHFE